MRILFQGDSITDADRSREFDTMLGSGYPTLVAAKLGCEKPSEYEFLNRGVSGNRIVDVYARIKADIINLKPDVVSILIGVNDVWHELKYQNGVSADKYYKIYCSLVEEIKAALPEVKIMILEPFVLKWTETESKWDVFRSEIEKRSEMARKVAMEYHLIFVPLQHIFDKAQELAPAGYWVQDGVHPTSAGHQLIKKAWVEAYDSI